MGFFNPNYNDDFLLTEDKLIWEKYEEFLALKEKTFKDFIDILGAFVYDFFFGIRENTLLDKLFFYAFIIGYLIFWICLLLKVWDPKLENLEDHEKITEKSIEKVDLIIKAISTIYDVKINNLKNNDYKNIKSDFKDSVDLLNLLNIKYGPIQNIENVPNENTLLNDEKQGDSCVVNATINKTSLMEKSENQLAFSKSTLNKSNNIKFDLENVDNHNKSPAIKRCVIKSLSPLKINSDNKNNFNKTSSKTSLKFNDNEVTKKCKNSIIAENQVPFSKSTSKKSKSIKFDLPNVEHHDKFLAHKRSISKSLSPPKRKADNKNKMHKTSSKISLKLKETTEDSNPVTPTKSNKANTNCNLDKLTSCAKTIRDRSTSPVKQPKVQFVQTESIGDNPNVKNKVSYCKSDTEIQLIPEILQCAKNEKIDSIRATTTVSEITEPDVASDSDLKTSILSELIQTDSEVVKSIASNGSNEKYQSLKAEKKYQTQQKNKINTVSNCKLKKSPMDFPIVTKSKIKVNKNNNSNVKLSNISCQKKPQNSLGVRQVLPKTTAGFKVKQFMYYKDSKDEIPKTTQKSCKIEKKQIVKNK